jgi:hypothetical protein
MNPYAIVNSGSEATEAATLRSRLMAWHDAMVSHERRLRAGRAIDVCDDECPHADAPGLWAEALAMLGERANELTFLRSRALEGSPSSESFIPSSGPSRMATAEL